MKLYRGAEGIFVSDQLPPMPGANFWLIDPAAGTVTHLVVEPEGRSGLARLVPLDLADAAPDGVRLRCTEAEFRDLDAAEETLAEFSLGYEVPVQLLPSGWRGTGGPVTQGGEIPRIPEQETVDVIPPGEVEERRGGPVHATDGDIGSLRALRIDPTEATGQVGNVCFAEGLVAFQGEWRLYLGLADSRIGVATAPLG